MQFDNALGIAAKSVTPRPFATSCSAHEKSRYQERRTDRVRSVISRSEIEQSFRDMVKSICCPECELEFTDYAVNWAEAWREGRFDLMEEHGWQERDGPVKLKCECCGHRFWLNYFTKTVTNVEPPRIKKKGR